MQQLVVTVLSALVAAGRAVGAFNAAFLQQHYVGNQYGYQQLYQQPYKQPYYSGQTYRNDKPPELVSCKKLALGSLVIANIWEERDNGYGVGHSIQAPFAPTFWKLGAFTRGSTRTRLEARIFLRVARGGDFSLIFTEKAFVFAICKEENFGKGLSLKSKSGGGYDGQRCPGTAPGGFGYSFDQSLFGRQAHTGYDQQKFQPDGFIEDVELDGGTPKKIRLDNPGGFTKAKQIAGRGLVLCRDVDVAYDGTATCVDIVGCCVLSYGHEHDEN